MTELGDIFAELGISHYLNEFIEQGFDTWETILDITESDFDALGVKLGHRRKLQRKIANSRGLSSDRALASPRNTPSDDRQPDEQRIGSSRADAREANGAAHGAKRKYRRHPKPDENAPERPPSAYVIFSNKMREELKGRNLSFTEIAKLVGENWQNLSPTEKEPYEQQASSAKEIYNNELAEYKKTTSYKEYSQYLVDFKARQANQQQVPDTEAAKRPKLEAHASTASNGTASSGASQYSGDIPVGRNRVESSASSTSPWTAPSDGHGMPKLNVALEAPKSQNSPNSTSPSVLPGYRDSIYGAGIQQSLPWRDGQRDDSSAHTKLPRLASISDRRPGFPGPPGPPGPPHTDGLIHASSLQHPLRKAPTPNQPPPLLTSESTNRSSTSSASTGSTSSFYNPRTPMEPPLERALSITPLYPQKSPGSLDNQLPPLRPPSLSPQSTVVVPQQSPNTIPSFLTDYASSMAPMRGYTATTPQNIGLGGRPDASARDFAPHSTIEETMDPVSALLKAGEIVNQNSRNQ